MLVFQIVEKLLSLSFRLPPCDDGDGSSDGCCTPDVCPSFIKNQEEIISVTGSLQYFNYVGLSSGIVLPAGFPEINSTIRQESWQFYDAAAPIQTAFNNITHAFDLPPGVSAVFFPQGEVYTKNTTPNQVPYTVDVRLFYNPSVFGRIDAKGSRYIRIKNCIVLKPPVDGVDGYDNAVIAPFNGTLSIAGGTAYEDDGITIMKVNSSDDAAGTLNTVVALPSVVSDNPILRQTDGVLFNNVEYTFKINSTLLVAKALITIGCQPDFALDKNFVNNTYGARININSLALNSILTSPPGAGGLPNIQSAQDCVINAITEFRESISLESATKLQETITNCLNTLNNDTNSALSAAINAGFDPYKSDFSIDPTIQFTTLPISLSVSLNEGSGNSMTSNIPASVASGLANKLKAEVSLGSASNFIYDGYGQFISEITSNLAGNGIVSVAFDNQFISILNNPTDIDESPSITIKEITYTFVQSSGISTGGEGNAVRRDDGDVSRLGAE